MLWEYKVLPSGILTEGTQLVFLFLYSKSATSTCHFDNAFCLICLHTYVQLTWYLPFCGLKQQFSSVMHQLGHEVNTQGYICYKCFWQRRSYNFSYILLKSHILPIPRKTHTHLAGSRLLSLQMFFDLFPQQILNHSFISQNLDILPIIFSLRDLFLRCRFTVLHRFPFLSSEYAIVVMQDSLSVILLHQRIWPGCDNM